MAEETRTELTPEQKGTEAAPVAPSGAGAEAPVAPTPVAAIAEPQKPIDLTSVPEFRKWQSERDRNEAMMRQQMTALQQRAQELEAQQYQLATAGMDDSEKASYENRMLRAQMASMQQQMQTQEVQNQLGSWMEQVMKTGRLTPEEAPNPKEYQSPWAWAVAAQEKAVAKAEKEAEKRFRQKEREERREATTVDTGSGAPGGTEKDRLTAEYNRLKGSGRLLEGLELKRKIDALR